MSTDSPTAAVPGPNDPTSTAPQAPREGQAAGLLASMVAPVEPARPAAFTLDPAPSAPAAGTGETALDGSSSAAFHPASDAAPGAAGGGSTARQGRVQQGVVKAWLLAGATRWAKGGGTHNKRLDVAKAKAQANQVKETRTVNIKRADAPAGPAPKNPQTPSRNGKGLDSKGNAGGSVKDPKNSNRNMSNGPAGRGNSGSNSGAGNRGGGGGVAPKQTKADQPGRTPKPAKPEAPPKPPTPLKAPKQEAPQHPKTPAPKPAKTGAPKPGNGTSGTSPGAGSGAGTGTAGGGKGTQGAGGSGGKAGKDAPAPTPASKTQAPAPSPAAPSTGIGTGKTPAKENGATPARPGGKVILDRLRPKRRRATPTPASGPDTGDAAKTKPDSADTTPDPAKAKPGEPGTKPEQPGKQPAPAGTNTGKPFSTRESREAGYRDGTRAARTVAHAKAYKDGLQDGYRDTTEAAQREKARLDAAHAQRKTTRDKEQPVPSTASSADYHQPQPIGVTEVTASHVHLGDGALRQSMTRGEVRSLKTFERRLQAKADIMTKAAEDTRGLKAHADQQAKTATKLLEDAKAVKGGEKLTAALAKLADAATAQAAKAEEVHKRALRAAENCRVVLANAETRYGGIYQAVVDSDEILPAELTFYKD